MTLTLNLSPELQARLAHEAQRRGLAPDEYAVRVLEQHLSPTQRAAAASALLQSWLDGNDAEEQQETGDYLVRVLDEDRPSQRKLFPPELKGVTW